MTYSANKIVNVDALHVKIAIRLIIHIKIHTTYCVHQRVEWILLYANVSHSQIVRRKTKALYYYINFEEYTSCGDNSDYGNNV